LRGLPDRKPSFSAETEPPALSNIEKRSDDAPNVTSRKDIEAFTQDTSQAGAEKPELTDQERNHEFLPQPLVKIVNYRTGDVTQASLAELNTQMSDFHKVILLIEDQAAASDACTKALHELGYDGVQLITHLLHAENHLDDIASHLTEPPAAIVLDLGLGNDSGFTVLRKCHAEPRLQQVPILVWTKHTDELSKTFSDYLGAQDYLVKSDDVFELRDALKRLLAPAVAA
jgi:CheY-like chemotaxis protein